MKSGKEQARERQYWQITPDLSGILPLVTFYEFLQLHFGSLRSRRLELVGTRKNGRARRRHARARSLFRLLLPSACYAGYILEKLLADSMDVSVEVSANSGKF